MMWAGWLLAALANALVGGKMQQLASCVRSQGLICMAEEAGLRSFR